MRGPTHRQDEGAAAVEFALLVPILVVILLAIVDYGVWFSDSIGVRHGASEAARAGAVGSFDPCSTGNDASRTRCVAVNRTGSVGGAVRVRVLLAGPGTGWAEGRTLIVCSAMKEGGLSNLAPLPSGGNLRTKSKTRIEVARPGSSTYVADADPSGNSWGWCV